MSLRLPHLKIPDVRGWLAMSGVAQVAMSLWLLSHIEVPAGNHDLFVVLISQVIGAGFLMIMQFYFGSSDGAKRSADRLNEMARSQLGMPPPDPATGLPPTTP